MPSSHRYNWLVCLGDLGLQLVDLLEVVSKRIIVLFLFHAKHGSKISAIGPLFALIGLDHDCFGESILIKRANASANLVSETW